MNRDLQTQTQSQTQRNRWILSSLALFLLITPLLVFRLETGALLPYFGESYPPGQGTYIVMRPVGYTALTLLFFQVVLGIYHRQIAAWAGLKSLTRVHKSLGILTLAMAFLHPFLFFLARSLRAGSSAFWSTFFPQPTDFYHTHLFFGALALYGLLVGALAGLYGPRMTPRHWRRIHYINYLLFPIAWYHSFFIGAETRHPLVATILISMLLIVVVLICRHVIKLVRGLSLS